MRKLVLIALLLECYVLCNAQTVSNVTAYQQGKNIVIEYDLSTTGPIDAFVSLNDSSFTVLRGVSGDVNKTVNAGHRKIIWNVLTQYDSFCFDNVKFKVRCGVTSVTDCQGNTYPVVKIGDQYWMAENLRCTRYDTKSGHYGLKLSASSPSALENSSRRRRKFDEPYYVYTAIIDTTSINLLIKPGLLYSWTATIGMVDDSEESSLPHAYTNRHRQGICPNGWHIPFDYEWDVLALSLGGEKEQDGQYSSIGKKLKSTSGWATHSNGTNFYNLDIIPTGYAHNHKIFGVEEFALFWTSSYSEISWSSPDGQHGCDTRLVGVKIGYDDSITFVQNSYWERIACSVRCVMD